MGKNTLDIKLSRVDAEHFLDQATLLLKHAKLLFPETFKEVTPEQIEQEVCSTYSLANKDCRKLIRRLRSQSFFTPNPNSLAQIPILDGPEPSAVSYEEPFSLIMFEGQPFWRKAYCREESIMYYRQLEEYPVEPLSKGILFYTEKTISKTCYSHMTDLNQNPVFQCTEVSTIETRGLQNTEYDPAKQLTDSAYWPLEEQVSPQMNTCTLAPQTLESPDPPQQYDL